MNRNNNIIEKQNTAGVDLILEEMEMWQVPIRPGVLILHE